jgi:hypothetical protein
MGIERGSPVSDDRERSDTYNAGITVKTKERTGIDYVEEVFQGRQPGYIPGQLKRQMMAFRVPTVGTVEMYINPQNFNVKSSKNWSEVRTKGGFVVQLWGEALDVITISGSTGSASIEGINILENIYRSEQTSFASTNAALRAKLEGSLNSLLANSLSQTQFGREVNKWLNLNASTRPTPASLATAMELIYMGVVYKGFFVDFSVTEQASQPGIFDYNMTFKSFAKRGTRSNFMPWSRSPYYGPANSNAYTPNYSKIVKGSDSKDVLGQFWNRGG